MLLTICETDLEKMIYGTDQKRPTLHDDYTPQLMVKLIREMIAAGSIVANRCLLLCGWRRCCRHRHHHRCCHCDRGRGHTVCRAAAHTLVLEEQNNSRARPTRASSSRQGALGCQQHYGAVGCQQQAHDRMAK